jgi:hypothetical protein
MPATPRQRDLADHLTRAARDDRRHKNGFLRDGRFATVASVKSSKAFSSKCCRTSASRAPVTPLKEISLGEIRT